jgi:4-diphosphocytidyl-2-C-methyl-D-erythritol kinase
LSLTETAYAKINLALHVRGRREDGYHDIETLFAFVDQGDQLVARFSPEDRLAVSGEFAGAIDDPVGNIISKTLTAFPRAEGLAVELEKNLPVSAGLGGGSADAGAVIRLIERSHGLPADWLERAAKLGADVPACVESKCCIGRGTGTQLAPFENDLAGMAVLLVNPRVPLATGAVFEAWSGTDRGALPSGKVSEIAQAGRNDLRPPAISLCPQIGQVLETLANTGAWKVEMSGSGATCFALYENIDHRNSAASVVATNKPDWWQMSGVLR